MSTAVNSLTKNKLLNKARDQNNNKSQKTLIQIPQEKSKPRIFLITRPSRPSLVRLETQTEPSHYPKKLNVSQLHHPQEVVNQKQAATTKIPFLPRSQGQTFSVKSNTNQFLEKDLNAMPVQYQNQNQEKQSIGQTLPENPIILEQVIRFSPYTTENSSNQLQAQQKSVKNTITEGIINTLNLSENRIIETKNKAQSEIPLTLASMAGIELTGADMSLSQADMSGAMPPTATVEEINVPVFIDEYLQEATASTSVTANNIFNINNNNNNNCNNIRNNKHSNEVVEEVNILDTLDNFEFDLNMLTEDCHKCKKTALEEDQHHLHQQQKLIGVDDDKKHQLQLQMMLEKILFTNNNTTSNNNNNNNNLASNIDLTDDLFKVAPYTEINDFLSPDDIDYSNFGTTQFNSEEAVDLNSISKDFSLDDCFINSQPTEIMFSSGYSQSQTSSQNIINEISKAEPHITPNKYSPIATTSKVAAVIKMEEYDSNDEVDTFCTSRYIDDDSVADYKEAKFLLTTPLKRNSSQTSQHMLEKRLKLRLDTKLCKENFVPQQSEINTPKVIDFIDQFNDGTMGATAADSIKAIYYDLVSSSPKCVSVKSEINIDDTTEDFSAPNTPYSVNSISNQTSFINTAPSSPASSIATTSNNSTTAKRGRGRPAKTHSDIPDRWQIQHLSESEQKKVLERAKNNEASRKSRLKHKERDNALEREEAELKCRNEDLEKEWEKWKKMEKKLKAAMKRQYLQF